MQNVSLTEAQKERLIAQSPALLAALKALVADIECYCADNVATKEPCPVHQAQAAILAAEGSDRP